MLNISYTADHIWSAVFLIIISEKGKLLVPMTVTTPKDHLYQLDAPRKMNKKNILILSVGIIAIVVVSYFFGNQKIALAPSQDAKSTTTKQTDDTLVTIPSTILTISNQIPGEVVLVDEVTMTEEGWVAVHDDLNGKPGNILGAYLLPAGTHKNQIIPLLRGVSEDKTYMVIIHQDDGDRVFDYKIDTPKTNSKGEIETAGFKVVTESSRG